MSLRHPRPVHTITIKHPLYAVAIEKTYRTEHGHLAWMPDGIDYVRADGPAEARAEFCRINPEFCDPNFHSKRIVAIGPAVGFFVDDAHGEDLSA